MLREAFKNQIKILEVSFPYLVINIYIFLDGWATDDLVYKWKDVDPVQIVPGLHLPRFTLEQYKSAYCNVITNTGASKSNKLTLQFDESLQF